MDRTPWKFGEIETARKTEVEDRRQGVVIFMKSRVTHVTLNRTFKFMSCQTTGSSLGDRLTQLFLHAYMGGGGDR